MSIQIKNVSYRYPTSSLDSKGKKSWALRNINLEISDGELLVVMGKNGSGKSTFCLLLNGLIPHFYKGQLTGDVIINGNKTTEKDVAELCTEIGVVFQNPFDQLTGAASQVFDEVAIGPENLGLPREQSKMRVEKALNEAGISDLADRHPFHLSGGQQQRVAIASILAMRPKIMVLDEPTSQLDPVGTDEVLAVIKHLQQQGMTIILAEHKVEAIAEIADRIIVLHEGRLVIQGTPKEVLTNPDILSYEILPPRYTELAYRLKNKGLWPGDIPLTLDETKKQILEVINGNH